MLCNNQALGCCSKRRWIDPGLKDKLWDRLLHIVQPVIELVFILNYNERVEKDRTFLLYYSSPSQLLPVVHHGHLCHDFVIHDGEILLHFFEDRLYLQWGASNTRWLATRSLFRGFVTSHLFVLCTVGQNNKKYRLQYWATCSSACSALFVLLVHSAELTRSVACSLCSLPCLWESGYFLCVFFCSRP